MRPYSLTLLIYPASAGYSVTVSTQYVNELRFTYETKWRITDSNR